MEQEIQVTFLGDVALDEYYSAPYFPKIKEKILVKTLPAQMGGMIANAACTFASYGTKPVFLAALNEGAVSQRLCANLNECGVDTQIVWDNALPDSKTIIILAEDEHTIFIPTMGIETIELSEETVQKLCASQYLYSTFCELRPIRCGEKNVLAVLEDIVKSGCKLWCDLDVAEIEDTDEAMFRFVDTLFINEMGLESLTKRAQGEAAQWLFDKGIQTIVVTLAENGCTVLQADGTSVSVDGIQVPVVDVTGAGDTFCSSFLYASLHSKDVRLCAEFANFAAAQAVTKMGARSGAVGSKAVLDFIAVQGGDIVRFAPF
ncbi:MAG: carbohydrate kinase family protein, partial [Ruthenibacterium sp.]